MHHEALTSDTKKLWPQLKHFPEFILAGGTALALAIGHRLSADFDFFSEGEIAAELLETVERVFADYAVRTILNTPEQLTVAVDDTKLTFLTYRFPLVSPPIEYQGVRLMAIGDIAATKAFALGRRATLKDYVDLYFIVGRKHCSLKEIVTFAQKKYGDLFDPRLFFEQLVYLGDVPDEKIQFLKTAVDKTTIEKFFENEIKKMPLGD